MDNTQHLRDEIAHLRDELAKAKALHDVSKFGLVWENLIDEKAQLLDTFTPIITEDMSKKVQGSKPQEHWLINGDNAHGLTALNTTHKEMVNVIYIDPPYNTGNKDFIYNDNYLDSKDKYQHSKWLSFMSVRLELARNLLSDSGVIFVSIDDSEQARLKLLMDEVFGARNFVSMIVWQSKSGGAHDSKTITTTTEYILVYAKNIKLAKFNKKKDTNSAKYKNKDEYYATRGGYVLDKLDRRMQGSHFTPALKYPITCPDGSELWPGGDQVASEENWNWRWSKSKVEWGLREGFLVFKKNAQNKWTVHSKQYEKVNNKNEPTVRAYSYRNLILSSEHNNTAGNREIRSILGSQAFTYPKPVGFVKHLLSLASTKDSLILDFFAGSGTTAQAVAEMNQEDGGSRHCILITDQGKTQKTTKNAINIAEEVAYERLRRVFTGKDYADGKNHVPLEAGLRYFTLRLDPKAPCQE